MKLLELLVQEKVQWPDGALWAVQDGDKELKFDEVDEPPQSPEHSMSGEVWYRAGYQHFDSQYPSVRASDWATKAVSKAEYDAAVAANAEWLPVKWGDGEVGDELRFDGFKFSKRKPSAAPATVPPTYFTMRDWYAELAPIIAAAAEGKVVQYLAADGNWYTSQGAFSHPIAYRVKPEEPKTIKVNGFDVPEPMREAPAEDTRYYLVSIHSVNYYEWAVWYGDTYDMRWLSHGILHSTKEAAVAHAKAMLGIDPYGTEDADDEHA